MSKNVNGQTLIPDNVERIVLNQFLRIGDRVQMAVKSNDDGWCKRKVQNGVQGTCIGFTRYETYQGRIGYGARNPRKYASNGAPIIRWDDGTFDRPSLHDIVFDDPKLRENGKHNREEYRKYQEAFEVKEFLEPLPELPFWELDLVKAVKEVLFEPDDVLLINAINWHYIGDFCTDGVTPMPLFSVTPIRDGETGWGSISVRPEDIELVKRGNVWNWFNDKSALHFDSLEDECTLHRQLDLITHVPNPKTSNYHWPAEDVLEAAQRGLIDAVSVSPGLFGSGSSGFAWKFHDENLGNRAREKLIEGFSN